MKAYCIKLDVYVNFDKNYYSEISDKVIEFFNNSPQFTAKIACCADSKEKAKERVIELFSEKYKIKILDIRTSEEI